jgi:PAS domain S-box-containing protein
MLERAVGSMHSSLRRYGIAVAACALAIAARLALNPVLGKGNLAYLTLLPTIVLVGLYAGQGPALLTVVLGALGAAYLVLPPEIDFALISPTDRAGLIAYTLLGGAAALLARTVERARRAAEENISDRKAAEELLSRQAAQLRLVTDAVPALIAYVDADRRYVFNNRAYQEWFGQRPEDVHGRHMRDVIGAAAYERIRPYVDAVLGGQRVQYEADMPYQHGGTRHIHAEYVPDLRPDGSVAGYFALVTDVTERKRAEEALRDADRRKDEFIAVLAHELRNPLAPIRTGLELMRVSGDKPESAARVRPMLERQVAHMVRLIDDLLDVSRITSGRIHLQRAPTPLHEVVESAVETNRAAIEAAGLALEVSLPDTSWLLDVDPTRMVQVLSNVLHNAVKFTSRGGRVTVSAAVERAGGGPVAVLTVRDTGQGIAPELLPRVFDLFVQGQPAGRVSSGLGIGLALARQLVEMHGGTIEASSGGPDRGSTFAIRIPALVPAPPADAGPGEETPRLAGSRVLVVDDNVDAAATLAGLVASLGGDARVAGDGATGLQLASEFEPHLVLLDIGMPGMDGYETCRRLRALPAGVEACIVALTGWGQPQDRERAAAEGFDAHLTKPTDAGSIARVLAASRRSRVR